MRHCTMTTFWSSVRFPSRLAPWLAAAAFAGLTAAGALAAGPLVAVHPRGLGAMLEIPSSWQVSRPSPGDAFAAASVAGDAHLVIAIGLNAGSFKEFVAAETAGARRYYRSQDPDATVAGHLVSLPAGRALEITALLHNGLAVTLFDFQHNDRVYHFSYYTDQSQTAMNQPVFERSARSIRFST
jgi:hypothetical protein